MKARNLQLITKHSHNIAKSLITGCSIILLGSEPEGIYTPLEKRACN